MKKERKKKYDRQIIIADIVKKRIEGKSTYNLLEYLMNEVGMSRKIAYDILGESQKEIMSIVSRDIDKSFADAIVKLEKLYEEADTKLKLEIQKEINKIKGIYEAQKIDITSGGKEITEIKLIQVNGNTGNEA